MKANEFFKKYGVAEAKNILNGMDDASEFTAHMPGDAWDKPTLIDAVGLRRLVESHELVESCGGLHSVGEKLTHGMYESRAVIDRLKQAIFDVESCL
ncbi:MAG: hypothetical protein RSE38_05455 [Acinetobacter sp.]